MQFGKGPAQPPMASFPMLDEQTIMELPDPNYLVDGVIPESGVGAMVGSWGTCKTFVAFDIAQAISHGLGHWHGRQCATGAVCYVAGEGAGGFKMRMKAWRTRFAREGNRPSPFFLIRQNVNLLDEDDVKKLIATIKDVQTRHGIIFKLLVIDTVSRALNGSEENAENFSKLIFQCEEIKESIGNGFTVLLVHHKGKDKDRGSRGSSVFEANADYLLDVDRPYKELKPDELVLKVAKLKDDADGEIMHLYTHRAVIGARQDGRPQESLYLTTLEEETPLEKTMREEARKPHHTAQSLEQEYQQLRVKILSSGVADGNCNYEDIKLMADLKSGKDNAKLREALKPDETHTYVINPTSIPPLIRSITRRVVKVSDKERTFFEIATKLVPAR